MIRLIACAMMCALLYLPSCQSGPSGYDFGDLYQQRLVSVITGHRGGTAPYQVYVQITYQGNTQERSRSDLVKELEIQFSDQLDWAVSTREALHTFGSPGAYSISARATYWDDEIVYSLPVIVTVTAP